MNESFHVHPSIHGGWVIRRTHFQHGMWFHCKKDAIKCARKLASDAGRSLYIHRRDGTVCEKVERN